MRMLGALAAAVLVAFGVAPAAAADAADAVGPQYDSVHVYVDPAQFDAFVRSWTATFGGTTSAAVTTHVTPTPSTTRSQLILSPVGTLSVFGFSTPVPYPFGAERGGWLTTDLDAALAHARAAGAATLVEPFDDPIGRDAVVQFPGGVNTQLYWHTTAPSYPALQSVPDNRVYLPPGSVEPFLRSYGDFTAAVVDSDNPAADGALLGKPGTTFRQIHLSGPFGNTMVSVTDGHLPYPFGRELAGYAVSDVDATLAKARSSGARVLSPPVGATKSAVLQFPGGYTAEIHQA